MNLRSGLLGLSMIPMSMGFMLTTSSYPSIRVGSFQIQVQTPDGSTEIPSGSTQLVCPFPEFDFNEDVKKTKSGVEYTFHYGLGTRSTANFTYSIYNFPDIVAKGGGAAMRNPYATAVCFSWWDPLTLTMEQYFYPIYYGGTMITLVSTESSGPARPPQEQPDGGTATTWCVFRNYWDENGNLLYREVIPNSCWTVYQT